MIDHYSVLGLKIGATKEEVDAAFEQLLADRRGKRQKTSDVLVAHAVLSEEALRRSYDLALRGAVAGARLNETKDAVLEAVADAIPDIKWSEVRRNAVHAGMQATVLFAGFTAKAADVTGAVARRVQLAAASRIESAR